jgi:AcrR family transcriptional regulator
MSEGTATAQPLGRPRDARADRAILAAALELIAAEGVNELHMDDVASRAGVGKATIYRRYESKEALVVAAVSELVSEIAIPDTGSTRGDLLALMREAVTLYTGSVAGPVMRSLVGALGRRPELAQIVRDEFLAKRRAALGEVIERGIARGDLRADLDLELAVDALGGALFYRLLITGGPIDDGLATGVVELILRGFAPDEGPRRRTSRTRRGGQT